MQKRRVADVIVKWQERLRLRDWDIRFVDGPTDDNCVANNDSWGLKQVSVIRMREGLTPEAEEREIVHELLHVVLRYIKCGWESEAKKWMPPPVYGQVREAAEDEEEIAIEKLVTALTGMPYIAPPGCNDIYASAFPMQEKSLLEAQGVGNGAQA
jgi:hypothetical protein